MKNFKSLFLYTFLILVYSNSWSWAQTASEIKTQESISTIYKSPVRIQKAAAVSLRFTTEAMAYLNWHELDGINSEYQVRYRTNDTDSQWTELNTSTSELVIDKLVLDTEYLWEIRAAIGDKMITSGQRLFSTFPQHEPIEVSDALYRPLSAWFSQQKDQQPFCDFLEVISVHPLEKLAFLQAYSFDNAALRKQNNFDKLSQWYPLSFQDADCTGFMPLNDRGDDIAAECRCKVITRGGAHATPSENLDSGIVEPVASQYVVTSDNDRAHVNLVQAGAAKYIALIQDKNGGSAEYLLTNLQELDAADNVSVTYSEIKFTLGCIQNGQYSTNLPEKCACNRPLDVSYEYTTNLHVKAKEKACIWDKGAAAQAEDYAFVMAFNSGTGELTALDAGQAVIGRHCNSSWNPDFWIAASGMLRPTLDYYLEAVAETATLPGTSQPAPIIPNEEKINEFWNALLAVSNTPFRNVGGDCDDEPYKEQQVLVQGFDDLWLNPNEPLTVTLFSNHYIKTKGYGCYRAEASIASDYRLTGVVESSFASEKCCSDKLANYIYGSLSTPYNGGIINNAVNSLNDRRLQVGNFLAEYGDWYNLPYLPTGGVGVEGEFGLVYGPSCKPNAQNSFQYVPETSIQSSRFQVYPTSSSDQVTIHITEVAQTGVQIRIVNTQGQEFYKKTLLNGGASLKETIDISNWLGGTYWVDVASGSDSDTLPFIKI